MKMLILAFFFMLCSQLFGETVITKRNSNYIREGAGAYYQLVDILPPEVSLEVISKQDKWIKVKYKVEKQGWISENSVQAITQFNKSPELQKFHPTSTKTSRAALVAAIKGLKGFSDLRIQTNSEKLDELIKVKFTPNELRKFREPFIHKNNERLDLSLVKTSKDKFEYDPQFDEVSIGYGVASLLAGQKTISNPELLKYLNLLVFNITEANDFYDYDFSLTVLDENQVDGYSCPGGFIFITSGAISHCDNEAELAGIIAHEISHLILGHGKNEIQERKTSIIMDKVFEEFEKEINYKISDFESELEDIIVDSYLNITKARRLEYEIKADQIATIILINAGYNPYRYLDMIDRISYKYQSQADLFHPNYLRPNEMKIRKEKLASFLVSRFSSSQIGIDLKDRFSLYKDFLK